MVEVRLLPGCCQLLNPLSSQLPLHLQLLLSCPLLPPQPRPIAAPVVIATTNPVNPPIVVATSSPTVARPVSTPVAPPVGPRQPVASEKCGDGPVDNGVSSFPGLCCSEWGSCGEGEVYCKQCTTPSPTAPAPSPEPNALQEPTVTGAYCGDGGAVGNGRCSVPELCCSKWGYCRDGAGYCEGKAAPTALSPFPPSLIEPSAPLWTQNTPLPTPAESSISSSLVTPMLIPDYVNGDDCSGVENVVRRSMVLRRS